MENTSNGIDRRAVAGILLIIAGAFLLFDQLDLLSFNLSYYLISWKTLLIGIGIITISNPANRTTGGILIGLGVLFFGCPNYSTTACALAPFFLASHSYWCWFDNTHTAR